MFRRFLCLQTMTWVFVVLRRCRYSQIDHNQDILLLGRAGFLEVDYFEMSDDSQQFQSPSF